jgi:cytochrome c oxidase subunit 2
MAMDVLTGKALVSADSQTHEIHVIAKKFSFEPEIIQVTAGERVRLVIRSADRLHGFAIGRLKIDVQVPGRYKIACSEFCGGGHGEMKSLLVSVPPG